MGEVALTNFMKRLILVTSEIDLISNAERRRKKSYTTVFEFTFSLINFRISASTQFEATNARRMFPCFDEPSYKAIFDLSVIHDPTHIVRTNMHLINSMYYRNGSVHFCFISWKKEELRDDSDKWGKFSDW